jgi:ubiquitin C-terminal hydrolase
MIQTPPHRCLMNLGNTCYANSVMQCMYACKKIRTFFLEHTHTHTGVVGAVCELFHAMGNKATNDALAPRDFLRACQSSFKKAMHIYEQNDAQEFYVMLLDSVTKGMQPCPQPPLNMHMTDRGKNSSAPSLVRRLDEAWIKCHKDQDMLLASYVDGQSIHQMKCTACQYICHNYECFNTLSLDVCGKRGEMPDLLRHTMEPELLEDWKCDECGNRALNRKSQKFWRLPEMLVMCLKKYDNTMRKHHTDGLTSLQDTLDMSAWSLYDQSSIYTLRACVCHSGSSQYGHYYALTKTKSQWLLYNDHMSCPVNNVQDHIHDVYILFYEKKG